MASLGDETTGLCTKCEVNGYEYKGTPVVPKKVRFIRKAWSAGVCRYWYDIILS